MPNRAIRLSPSSSRPPINESESMDELIDVTHSHLRALPVSEWMGKLVAETIGSSLETIERWETLTWLKGRLWED